MIGSSTKKVVEKASMYKSAASLQNFSCDSSIKEFLVLKKRKLTKCKEESKYPEINQMMNEAEDCDEDEDEC